ncbi:MAG: hypothetical protein ACTSPB_06450 [Candidatus Thorarchaeota archaeon]
MIRRISEEDYLALSKELNFSTFPRTAGFPSQFAFWNFSRLFEWMRCHDGEGPLFVSHNSYQNVKQFENAISVGAINMENVLFDFDSGSMEKSRKDALKLSQELDKYDVCHHVRFTAGKGFQLEIHCTPQLFAYNVVDGSADYLSLLLRMLQVGLVDRCKLTTADPQIIGDPKRLRRIEYSYYVNCDLESNGRNCIPLTREQLRMDSKHIIEYSKSPIFSIPQVTGKKYTFIQLFEVLGIDVKDQNYKFAKPIGTELVFGDDSVDQALEGLVNLLRREKPCILEQMLRVNPPHRARVMFALFAKRIGMSMSQFEQIYVALGSKVGYADLHNDKRRETQIESLFSNPKYVREPNCQNLIRVGYCIGEKCPRFWTDKKYK